MESRNGNPSEEPICPSCRRSLPAYLLFCNCGRKNDKFDEKEFEGEVGGTLEETLAECRDGRNHNALWKELEAAGEADFRGYCEWCGIPIPPPD